MLWLMNNLQMNITLCKKIATIILLKNNATRSFALLSGSSNYERVQKTESAAI